MATWERSEIYLRGRAKVTPRQRRRLIHKENRRRSQLAKARIEVILKGGATSGTGLPLGASLL